LKHTISFHVSCVVDDSKPAAPSPIDVKMALEDCLMSPDSEYGVSDVHVTHIPNEHLLGREEER
jgi:hypothetical protein